MIALSVIGGLGTLVSACLQLADATCAHNRNVRVLANRIELLIPLIEEVKAHHEQVSATVTPTFKRLEEVLKKAHNLFAECKNSSRLYLVAKRLSIMEKFKDVTSELDGVMSMLPMALLSVSNTIKEQVQVMRQELHGVQYTVEEGISTLSKDMAAALQAQKSKAPHVEMREKLKLLAKEVHLTSREQMEREAKALLEEKRAAHNKHLAAEEEDIDRVLELLRAMGTMAVPEELLCPISRELMKDPVFVVSGQSYDRDSIQKWFHMGHNTDPLSGQLLEHSRLTPNYALKSLISTWKEQHGWREGDNLACANPSAPPMPDVLEEHQPKAAEVAKQCAGGSSHPRGLAGGRARDSSSGAPRPAEEDNTKWYKLGTSCVLGLTGPKGDLTKWFVDGRADAIVNAANEGMLGGGGLDGAIHKAAGRELYLACKEVPEVRGRVRCPTGEARLTRGFRLPAGSVIHTVGPVYRNAIESARWLEKAYISSLKLADESRLKYVAFPAISCGAYGYPHIEAAEVAVKACKENTGSLKEVHFVLFERAAWEAWVAAAERLLGAP